MKVVNNIMYSKVCNTVAMRLQCSSFFNVSTFSIHSAHNLQESALSKRTPCNYIIICTLVIRARELGMAIMPFCLGLQDLLI